MDTTDGVEMVEVVDIDDRVIATVTRAEMRRQRLRHRAVFVAVTDGAGRLLVHRRSATKDVWPGWCDIAVGGVVAAGEDYRSAARRELVEEIGIGVDAVGSGLVTLDDGFPRPYDDTEVSLLGRCFQITSPGPFRFLDGEVAEAWWTGRDELTELLGREKFLPDSVRLLLPLIRW